MKIKFLKAGNGDSIWISYTDEEGNSRNILIDGGVSETYFDPKLNRYGDLYTTIQEIKSRKEKIDLLILSHIDNDHIEGLLQWFEMDEQAHMLVEKVWFNSGKAIAGFYKEEMNDGLKFYLRKKSVETGVPEALIFEDYLLKHKLWDKKLVVQGDTLDLGGCVIKVLTPTHDQLKKLLKEYKNKTKDPIYTGAKISDWSLDLKKLILAEERPDFKFRQDNSVKNGSSISCIIEYKERKFLFLADSHPKAVIKALIGEGYTKTNPLKVDFFQIAHHGSKANNNRKLLEIVRTNNYVISTDSSTHHHPHKSLLGRIIAVNQSATLHFNYDRVRKGVFTKNDFEDYKEFKTRLISEYDGL
ncbi:ComEC/Rec2 family competence protein [Autumnicola musiva]|uniref:MBL fold metallo-hydrolase n=1 Tax=Autumnicola musiva TaxID=3075589 RepID=A0ABU3D711_9FLAO|nr:MBL fold metallo-hydrolase [Zunongwangia sp. F117]MDT0677320.1 MBL fold metallo-hydrolase [Zunongwangia sp. F117]